MNKKFDLCGNVLFAFAITLFPCVLVPLQTFLGNHDVFDYSCLELLWHLAVVELVGWTVCAAILMAGKCILGKHFSVLIAILCSLLVYSYLETGILSIGLPTLNGASTFDDLLHKIIDTVVFVGVLAAAILRRKTVLTFRWWVVCIVYLMSIAALFDAKKKSDDDSVSGAQQGLCFCLRDDIYEHFRFSSTRNALLFVLDSMPASVSTHIMESNPELQSLYTGFTAYRNNIAMHEKTSEGLPGLMTGNYLGSIRELSRFQMSMADETSLIHPYLLRGYSVYCASTLLSFMSKTLFVEKVRQADGPGDFAKTVLLRSSKEIPYLSLVDISIFRVAPYLFKQGIYQSAMKGKAADWTTTEQAVYPKLAKGFDETKTNGVLGVFHTVGVHLPLYENRNGELYDNPRRDLVALEETAYYKIKVLGEFLAGLKRRGIYDRSFIVVAADHGNSLMQKGKCEGSESSILWVKPIGEGRRFTFSDLPTSNCKVCELFKQVSSRDLATEEINGILESHNRRFRCVLSGGRIALMGWSGQLPLYREWIFDDGGRLVSLQDKR